MSHIVCPLCGKNAPLSTFDPDSLELDILAVSFKGLGRGRGFEVSEKYSILGDDDVTPRVVNRVIELCGFLVKSGTIDPISLSNRLGLAGAVADASGINKLKEEAAALRKQLAASQNQIRGERASYEYSINELRVEKGDLASTIKSQAEELEENEAELANIEDQLQEIVDMIEEYTDDEYDPTDESRIEFIQGTLQKLLEDLEALRADREE